MNTLIRLENKCFLSQISFIPASSLLADMSIWVMGDDLVTLTEGVNAVACGSTSEI